MSVTPNQPSPFDRPDADIILRSSDGVEFRAHKLVLSLASPVFDDMFSMPQPKPSNEDTTLPIVQFDEDSVTLEILLRDCYPIPDHVFTDISDLMKVLRAADKYQVDRTLSRLEQVYITLCADEINKKPVEAYVLACQRKWSRLSHLAVKASLLFAHDQIQAQLYLVDFSAFSGECLTLLQYHFKCCAATRTFLSTTSMSYTIFSSAKEMLGTSGPLAIVKDMESATRDLMRNTGDELDIPSKLMSHITGVVGETLRAHSILVVASLTLSRIEEGSNLESQDLGETDPEDQAYPNTSFLVFDIQTSSVVSARDWREASIYALVKRCLMQRLPRDSSIFERYRHQELGLLLQRDTQTCYGPPSTSSERPTSMITHTLYLFISHRLRSTSSIPTGFVWTSLVTRVQSPVDGERGRARAGAMQAATALNAARKNLEKEEVLDVDHPGQLLLVVLLPNMRMGILQ
ncbi:hypothetical protein ONZ45_g4571 [Pleurotus djamor]|nr:hypothetical protein ONZ45_g4571 [Pleurotus djamor]